MECVFEARSLTKRFGERQGRLWVRETEARSREFEACHRLSVDRRPLSLEEMFPLLIEEPPS